MLPALFKITVELARKNKIPYVRVPREDPFAWAYLTRLEKAGLSVLSKWNLRKRVQLPVKYTDYFLEIRGSKEETKRKILHVIRSLTPGITELLVHPGSNDLAISERFKWNILWESELETITDDEVKEELLKNNVELVNFCSVPPHAVR